MAGKQTIIGPSCTWCECPAVGKVETAPAEYKSVKGERKLTKQAIVVPACDDHLDILAKQPPDIPLNFRRTKAKDVDQLGFDMNVPVVQKRSRSAIYKDAA